MNEQTQKAVAELRKGCQCLFIEVDSSVAGDIKNRAESLITAFTAELESAQREIDRHRATNPASLRAANGAIRNLLKEYENKMQAAQRERDVNLAELRLYRVTGIDKLIEERDQAQAACGEMRSIIQRVSSEGMRSCSEAIETSLLNEDQHASICVLHKALSTTCGQGILDERERLRKALEFYAHDINYEQQPIGYNLASNVEIDKGEIAREALAPAPEGKK